MKILVDLRNRNYGEKREAMINNTGFLLNKKIAKLRHKHTCYNQNLKLMYDENGKQTELRKEVNRILYKIATGEFEKSYLAGVNSEIKYAKKKIQKEEKLKSGIGKKHKKKKEQSIAKQQAALLRGLKNLEKQQENHRRQVCLSKIGLLKTQLQQSYRKALPYYKD